MDEDVGISFESQERCRMIKEKFRNENFSFEVFTEDTVTNTIKNLKVSVSNDIPVSIMKEAIDAYCPKLTQIMSNCLTNNFFPDIVKNAETAPCFKKGDKSEKENYRPVSILSNFSKNFERLIYNQRNEFKQNFQNLSLAFEKPQCTIRTTKNEE